MTAIHLARTRFRTKAPQLESSLQRSTAVRRTAPTPRVTFVPTYQFEPQASKSNAFAWLTGEPSIFSNDSRFVPTKTGESRSAVAARAARTFEESHGRSQCSIFGISEASDKRTEEFIRQKRLARDRKAA